MTLKALKDQNDADIGSSEYSIILSLSKQLNSFAAKLTKSERHALTVVLLNSMEPMDRIRLQSENSLLNEHELKILEKLQNERFS